MSDFVQVMTTVATRDDAERIAQTLVERGLAGCVQIDGPIASVYRWHGTVERAEEWRCTVKTTAARFAALRDAIAELHAYDVPEIVATPIVDGSAAYLAWLDEATR